MNKILLNGNIFKCKESDLPFLIHGEEKAGSSLFTVTLAANLFSTGCKLLFLTGYVMAKEEFLKQTQSTENKNIIFCLKDQTENFINYLNTLPDMQERIIAIKNIDLFDERIFDLVSENEKIIISGDISRCIFKDKILNKDFKTKVFFSKLENTTIPNLQKYEGFLEKDNITGIVTTKI